MNHLLTGTGWNLSPEPESKISTAAGTNSTPQLYLVLSDCWKIVFLSDFLVVKFILVFNGIFFHELKETSIKWNSPYRSRENLIFLSTSFGLKIENLFETYLV